MTNLTKYEMETVVNYNAGEQTATVYKRDNKLQDFWFSEYCNIIQG